VGASFDITLPTIRPTPLRCLPPEAETEIAPIDVRLREEPQTGPSLAGFDTVELVPIAPAEPEDPPVVPVDLEPPEEEAGFQDSRPSPIARDSTALAATAPLPPASLLSAPKLIPFSTTASLLSSIPVKAVRIPVLQTSTLLIETRRESNGTLSFGAVVLVLFALASLLIRALS
jgi:hypothetical protein